MKLISLNQEELSKVQRVILEDQYPGIQITNAKIEDSLSIGEFIEQFDIIAKDADVVALHDVKTDSKLSVRAAAILDSSEFAKNGGHIIDLSIHFAIIMSEYFYDEQGLRTNQHGGCTLKMADDGRYVWAEFHDPYAITTPKFNKGKIAEDAVTPSFIADDAITS